MEIKEEQPKRNECNFIENNSNTQTDTDTNGSSLGKFKSQEDLLNAYENLEKEFTKKCQRLKELEAVEDNEIKASVKATNAQNSPETVVQNNEQISKNTKVHSIKDIMVNTYKSLANDTISQQQKISEDDIKEYIYSNPDIRNQFIINYINEIQSQQSAPVIVNSNSSNFCVMPKNKPLNLKDAGEYAKEFLNN